MGTLDPQSTGELRSNFPYPTSPNLQGPQGFRELWGPFAQRHLRSFSC